MRKRLESKLQLRQSGAPKRTKQVKTKPSRPSRNYDWSWFRLTGVSIVLGLLWASLWCRAYYVQVMQGPKLASMASKQHQSSELVSGERGQIFDSKGRLLAKSVEIQSVYVRPSELEDPTKTLQALSEVLGTSVKDLANKLGTRSGHVWMARQIGDQAAAKVKDAKIKGAYLTTEYMRLYPNKHLAGQLIGFSGLDDQGLEGLEASFNDHLSGKSALYIVQRDAAGNKLYLDVEGREVDVRGKDVKLTLDTNIQFVAEEALSKTVTTYNARWGACLVVEVESGNILAWAENPPFNPNNYKKYSPNRWRNHSAIDTFEPGSCLKPLVVASGMQESICNAETIYHCENGKFNVAKKVVRDVHPHDLLSVRKIVRYSSNIGAAKIALQLGKTRLYSYLNRLGYGDRTGLPLVGESRGVLRPPGSWEEIETATIGFGQAISVTALQMAKAYLCLANFGVSKPLRLVLDPPMDNQPEMRIFSPNVVKEVLSMLSEVVELDGTGKRAKIEGLRVAGKTSTAQKASPNGGYGDKVVASFIGFFPMEKPEYLIVVVVDEPEPEHYGGVVAAPAFREVALKTLSYLGRLPEIPLQAAEEKFNREAAAQRAETDKRDTRVRLVEKGKVPDVVGLSVRRAVEVLAGQGVVPTVKGEGMFVTKQAPLPGKPWAEQEKDPGKCILWLSSNAKQS